MGWNEFRRMPPDEQLRLLEEARGQKEKEKIKKKDIGIFRLPEKSPGGEYERLEESQLKELMQMLSAGGEGADKVIRWMKKNATCLIEFSVVALWNSPAPVISLEASSS